MDAKLSEYGGAASTISESIGILSSSSRSWTMYTTFRIQANIWVELAELFLEMDRVTDVQACVEEACNIFQNSHQAIYLKVILLLFIINCCVCIFVCLLVHIFYLNCDSKSIFELKYYFIIQKSILDQNWLKHRFLTGFSDFSFKIKTFAFFFYITSK